MRVPRIAAHVFALEWGAETDVAHRVVPANGLNDADHFMLVVSVPVEHEEQRRGIVVDMAKGVEHIRLLGSSYSYVVNRQMNRNQSKMRSRYMSTSCICGGSGGKSRFRYMDAIALEHRLAVFVEQLVRLLPARVDMRDL